MYDFGRSWGARTEEEARKMVEALGTAMREGNATKATMKWSSGSFTAEVALSRPEGEGEIVVEDNDYARMALLRGR